MDSDQGNMQQIIYEVLASSDLETPQGFISVHVMVIALWEIWKLRCRIRFEGIKPRFQALILNVKQKC